MNHVSNFYNILVLHIINQVQYILLSLENVWYNLFRSNIFFFIARIGIKRLGLTLIKISVLFIDKYFIRFTYISY